MAISEGCCEVTPGSPRRPDRAAACVTSGGWLLRSGPQCPSLYTEAWTPAWTPQMSSVTGGLGLSPPAVTETPRPRLKRVPTSPSFAHLSELPSVARRQAAQQPHGDMGTSHLRVSCGVRWEMLFKTRFGRTLKLPCQPRTILALVRVAQNWGVPPPPSPGCATAQGRTPSHEQSFSPRGRSLSLSWLGVERGAGGGWRVRCSGAALPLAQAERPR